MKLKRVIVVLIAILICNTAWHMFMPLRYTPEWSAYYRLLDAVDKGDYVATAEELGKGTDPNRFPKINEEDIAVLCVAADHGDTKMVQLLLDHKADPNITDGWNYNPLTAASIHNHLDVMTILVAHGASIGESDDWSSALWRASVEGRTPAVKFLLAHGANPNMTERIDASHSVTLLSVVKEFHHSDVAKVLAQAGAKG